MQLELYEIINAFENYTDLKKANELPFKLAWTIEDILEPLKKHYERFYEEKNKIVKELGKPDPKNKDLYMIEPGKQDEFKQKIDEIGQTKVNLKTVVKIDKKALFDSDIKINGNIDLNALKLFIK